MKFSTSQDGTILMWAATTGQFEGVADADPSTMPAPICASPDGKHIASGRDDGTSKVVYVGGVSSNKRTHGIAPRHLACGPKPLMFFACGGKVAWCIMSPSVIFRFTGFRLFNYHSATHTRQ